MNFRTLQILSILLLLVAPVLAHADKKHEKDRSSQVERTIAADSQVVVSACSVSGRITVHGWDRNSVRVRSSEAAEISFQRRDSGADNAPAKKIELLILDKTRGPRQPGFCESSSEIEMDVPKGASVQLRTRDSDISVSGVAAAYVNSQNGDIVIERVASAVEAGTIGGEISLQDSKGRINLHTAGGNIEAQGLSPAEAGDIFEAQTLSGDISLDHVMHTQLSAHTLNGSLSVSGPLAHGGRYAFRTMSGDMTLSLPEDSSFQVNARFSQRADVITDFPLTVVSQSSARSSEAPAVIASLTPPPPPAVQPGPLPKDEPHVEVNKVKTKVIVNAPSVRLRRLEAVYGSGDAKLDLSSFSGNIHLRKL